jgi:hypothetical protein
MARTNEDLVRQSDELYERYGKPYEAEHWGEYVAIAPDGRTVIGPTLDEVTERAAEILGRGVFVFKVGPKVVLRI